MHACSASSTIIAHRYPKRSIRAAGLRTGAGLATISALALASGFSPALSVLYASCSAIFVAYAVRTILRAASTIVSDETGLRVLGPRFRNLPWMELTDVRLAYYTTRRDGENGWMALTVRGPGGTIKVDSDIEGFAALAKRCHAAAIAGKLDIMPMTARNFEALVGAGQSGLPSSLSSHLGNL